jgi:hypothetical protein
MGFENYSEITPKTADKHFNENIFSEHKTEYTLHFVDQKKYNFQHTGTSGDQTTGTHTTPIHRYVDDLTFVFKSQSDSSCIVDVSSNQNNNVTDFKKEENNLWS